MRTYSQVLDPNVGEQHEPGAAASFDGTLFYIGNGHSSGIWILSRQLGANALDPNEDPSVEQTYWKQTVLDQTANFTQPVQYSAATDQATGAAIIGENLYFVWVQDDATASQPSGSVWATQLVPGSGPTAWSQPVQLLDPGGGSLNVSGGNFAVMGWGQYLIGCYNSGPDLGVRFLVYDITNWPVLPQDNPASLGPFNHWSSTFPDFANFPPQGQLGNQVGIDWFTTAGTPPTPSMPAIYWIVSFFNSSTGVATVLHLMNILPFEQWSPSPNNYPFQSWLTEQWTNVSSGVNIRCDPGGRVRAYYTDGGNSDAITVRILDTETIGSDGFMRNAFGEPTLLYEENTPTHMAPVPAFVIGDPQTSTTAAGKIQTVQQVYEFVIFPLYSEDNQNNDHINLMFSNFGKAVAIADAYQMPFTPPVVPEGEQKLILTGLVDSPLPMPAVNVASRQSAYNVQTIGSVTYGTTQVTGEKYSTNWSWSAGIMSSGKSTKGFGPAWNISFKAGTSGATGGSSATQLGMQLIADTNVEMTAKELVPEGALFAASVEYHRDEYTFYDLSLDGSTYTPASNAPQITAIWIEYTGQDTQAFDAYANTPGNIWSYTRDGWNARMQQLGYQGTNYFDDVIVANAVAFQDGTSTSSNLQFAWSTNSEILTNFNTVDNSFTESGWQLNASAYAGISWGAGVSVFGIGENSMGELLVGASYSRTTQKQTSDGHSWGVNVTYNLQNPVQNPPYAYPGAVTALSWKLWLLQANALWTQELIQNGGLPPSTIDPGSAPWRIIFEVDPDSVVFYGDNKNVVYCAASGEVISAWYNPAAPYSYGPFRQAARGARWGWTNLTQVASAFDGSAGAPPTAVGAPYWFAWGLTQPGYLPYTQAVVYRSEPGDITLMTGVQWPVSSAQSPPPSNTAWQWRDLAQIPGVTAAAGNPVGFHLENGPSGGPELHIFYVGVDGDLHELWAARLNQQHWANNSLTSAFPQAQKPASDPCALVWDDDPAGPSQHVFYRGNDGSIYGLRYSQQWTLTNLSEATQDSATPQGKPAAFVWNGSLHVGYRGSSGEIHELRFAEGKWQPADDPSWDAHATAPEQMAAAVPISGLAWMRRQAPQTIHWFYLTGGGAVAELYRYDAAANSWSWNNLSEMADNPGNAGNLPPVALMLQGNAWYFDPVHGSSMQLYLCDGKGSIYELQFAPDAPNSQNGSWQWIELTGYVTDSDGNPLPAAAVSN